jgi:hypothetical protein
VRTNCLYKLNFDIRVRRRQMSADMGVVLKANAKGAVRHAFPDAEKWTYIMIRGRLHNERSALLN